MIIELFHPHLNPLPSRERKLDFDEVRIASEGER
jgi:hypothetical protein